MGSDGFLAGSFFGTGFMRAFRLGCNMTHHAIAFGLPPTPQDSNFTSAESLFPKDSLDSAPALCYMLRDFLHK